MALGSQVSNVDAIGDVSELMHDIFIGKVVNKVRRESPTSTLFQDAQPGEYRLEGTAMKFAVDLRFKTGAMATDGKIPDHTSMDAVEGSITPIRRYARLAIDNLVEKRASGPGAYDDLSGRIFDQLWDSWKSMEIRHAIGGSNGLLGKVVGGLNPRCSDELEVRIAQRRVVQTRVWQIGPPQVSPLQVCSEQVCAMRVGADEDSALQRGTTKLRCLTSAPFGHEWKVS